MKNKIIILVITLFFFYNTNGQNFKKASHHHCKKVQVSDTIFLVRETEKILIVSFKNLVELKKDRYVSLGSEIQIWDWKNNKPDVQYWNHPKIFYKTQNLYNQQKKDLLEILYGNKKGDHLEVYFDENCSYAPHHAMIFYGKNDKVLGYLEICF
ncbi:hypothetical protein AD998_15120 [bacterium 336/3]|nr:hypothetical protein AD998_15120 [bacterium 336/3]